MAVSTNGHPAAVGSAAALHPTIPPPPIDPPLDLRPPLKAMVRPGDYVRGSLGGNSSSSHDRSAGTAAGRADDATIRRL